MHNLYLNTQKIDQLIEQIKQQLDDYLTHQGIHSPCMIGIHTGGVWLAEKLHQKMHIKEPLGTLDISFYRDDFTRIGMHPQVNPSNIQFNVEDQHILLIDDVLQTGRTIRAAMNEIFDFGRPASITLIVLADRDGRELPVQANIVGIKPDLSPIQQLKLTGPEPLELSIQNTTIS